MRRMRFSQEIIWRSLYLYFKFPVSLRDVMEIVKDRGVNVHHSSIYRWVLKFGPILEERFRKHKMPVNISWRMDETYIKGKGEWKYLYRAVDKFGQTIDSLLRAKRDHKAAMRFFKRAIKSSGSPKSVVIDGSYTNKGALQAISCESRKNNPIDISKDRYINNRIEQDHRKVKRKMKMSLNF